MMELDFLFVKYGSTTIDVPLGAGKITSIADVKSFLLEQLEVDPDSIKLISGGKVLESATLLSALGSRKVTMMASKKAQLAAAAAASALPRHQQVRVKNDLDAAAGAGGATYDSMPSLELSRDSRFGDIQTLPGLPFQERAREILCSLANDAGVVAVMKKRDWRVGALCELFPEGEVGVSDVCILGLNENKGQRILLRIRTDDLSGFRNMATITKTLCHELSHNVHGDHDAQFYSLMRQVEAEVVALDWRKSSGKTVSGSMSSSSSAQYAGAGVSSSASRVTAAPAPSPRGHILGDTDRQSTGSAVFEFVPTNSLAAIAAMRRRDAEEITIERGCGCACDSPRSRSASRAASASASASGAEALQAMPYCAEIQTQTEEMQVEVEVQEPVAPTPAAELAHQSAPDATPAPLHVSESATADAAAAAAAAAWLRYYQGVSAVSERVDEAIALSFSFESSTASAEKLLELHASLLNLLRDQVEVRFMAPAQVFESVSLLAKIVKNAHDPAKSAIDTSKSKLFQRVICRRPDVRELCLQVLAVAGFTQATSSSVLTWTRADLVALKLVEDVLDTALEIMQPLCS